MKRWFVFALASVIILSVNAGAVVANKATLQENQPAPFLLAWEPSARYGHSMVNLNGKAYLFGGATAFISDTLPISSSAAVNGYARSMLLNDMSIYDPNLTVWTPEDPVNDPPPPRKNHSVVALGEKMYILFGEGESGLLQDIWVYDPLSKEWQEQVISSVSKPAARYGHTTVTMFGQIFVYGGKTATGAVNDLWSFDPRTRTWTQRENGPNAVYGHTAVADTGGRMYVNGGTSSDQTMYGDLLSYDLNTNTWENIAVHGDLPSPRAFHVATFENNKITIATGRGYNSSGVLTDLDDAWMFDIVTEKWVPRAEYKAPPRSFSAAVVVPKSSGNLSQFQNLGLAPRATSGTVILFFGGLRDGQTIAETFEYTGQYLLYLPFIAR